MDCRLLVIFGLVIQLFAAPAGALGACECCVDQEETSSCSDCCSERTPDEPETCLCVVCPDCTLSERTVLAIDRDSWRDLEWPVQSVDEVHPWTDRAMQGERDAIATPLFRCDTPPPRRRDVTPKVTCRWLH